MKRRNRKLSTRALVVLALIALGLFYLSETSVRPRRSAHYDTKLSAARAVLQGEHVLAEAKGRLGLATDRLNDPRGTGVIGEEYTPITTDQARLSTKLLSANPNFAAVVVELLSRARLKQGDKVAVALTGSLPGLNLAVLAAIEALGLRPVIITSVGASMWGANDPEFTWLDMERVLFERGVIRHRSQAASIGSGGDSGQGLSPEGRDLIRGAIRRNGVILIEEPRLSLSIRRRVILYDSLGGAGQPHAYVNVGGGLASLGSTANGKVIPPGLSRDLTLKEFPSEGVITLLARRRIPIIHLMEIEKLADLYGLPLDPDLDQPVGQGRVYLSPRYSVPVVLVCAVVLVVVTLAFVHIDLRYYLGRLIKRTPGAESPTSRHPSETSG